MLAMPFARARGIEDRHADMLVTAAIARGHRTLVARTPRLLIDLNRAETDFEPSMIEGSTANGARPTHRARGGLGLIPDRLPGAGQLWNKKPDVAVLTERIANVHRPYHASLSACLATAKRGRSYAILIDIHSMPPITGRDAADVVIGDLHGRSAKPEIVDAAHGLFERHGLRVGRNVPYAGGHILERHANPSKGIYALQIEIDRRLYLDSRLDTPGAGMTHMMNVIADLADELATRRFGNNLLLAAE